MQPPDPLITAAPDTMNGAPVFGGTRVPVKTLFDYIKAGDPISDFLADFPNVTRDHAVAVLELARRSAIDAACSAAAERRGVVQRTSGSRVLLDNCVPKRLGAAIAGHMVTSVIDLG